jgi:DNA-binding winged helix-turn-helix (wHTH) protein/tetratricopeptide (TPR) repeat protein
MPTPIYRFDDCRLDVATRELLRAGQPVATSPTVFDCLAYLIRHRDRAVGRDELVAAVWGKTDVTDAALAKTVLKARRAVGDSGEAQERVRTIPRFGFRWIGEAREEESMAGPADDSTRPASAAVPSPGDAPGRIGPLKAAVALFVLVAALVIGIGHLGGFFVASDGPTRTDAAAAIDTEGEKTLAVLPIDVEGSSADAWLRLGLMDLIAHQLRGGGLAVLPSESVVRLADDKGAIDTATLAEATNADLWLASSLRRIDSSWLLRVQMSGSSGVVHEVEARGDNPIDVGRDASRMFLTLLDRPAALEPAREMELPATELIQRIEASLLVDDLATAGELLRTAPAGQKELPELRLREAQVDYWSGRADAAHEKLKALEADFDAQTNAVFRARVLTALGSSAVALGRTQEGQATYDRAIALLETLDSPLKLGQARVARGLNHVERGRYEEARRDFSLARTAFHAIDDQFELASVDYCEGYLESRRNRPLAALAAYGRVAERFERFGAIMELASVHSNVVATQLDLLRAVDAVETSDANMQLLARLQNPGARNQVRLSRATALAATGRFAEAQVVIAEAKPDLESVDDPVLSSMARIHEAEIALETGRPDDAYRLAHQAGEVPDDPSGQSPRARAWLAVVRALVASGHTDEATAEVARFVDWASASDDEQAMLYSQLAAASQAGPADARSLYRDMLRRIEHEGVPRNLALVSIPYARALMATHDMGAAASVAGRLVQYADQDFGSALLLLELYHAMGETDAWRAALTHAQEIAGERTIPAFLRSAPRPPEHGGPAARSGKVVGPNGDGRQSEGKKA